MGTPDKPSSVPVDTEGAIRAVSEMVLGSRIVYPNQGVCRVGEIQSKEIAGQRLDFVSMTREEDGATILVPVNKVPSIGLRHVADSLEIGDVFDLLASSFDDPELDWKVRHRMHGDLMSAGGVLGVAEVLKALQALSNLRPLPQKERERYDAARHLLVHEVAVALGVPECTAEDFIDLALIPPPGTVRPAAKPRRLATLPPKLLHKPVRPAARGGEEGEELDEFGLLDEELPGLGLEEEGLAEGEEATEETAEGETTEGAEAEGEAAEGEEPPKSKKAKAPAKAKKAKKAAVPPPEAEAEVGAAAAAPEPPEAPIEAPEVEAPAPSPAEPVAAEAVALSPAPVPAVELEEPEEEPAPAKKPAKKPVRDEVEAEPEEAAPARVAKAAEPKAKKATVAPAKKPAAEKAPAKKPAAEKVEKPAPKKTAAKEPPAKKAPAKKPAAKEAPAKKPAATKPKTAAKKK